MTTRTISFVKTITLRIDESVDLEEPEIKRAKVRAVLIDGKPIEPAHFAPFKTWNIYTLPGYTITIEEGDI